MPDQRSLADPAAGSALKGVSKGYRGSAIIPRFPPGWYSALETMEGNRSLLVPEGRSRPPSTIEAGPVPCVALQQDLGSARSLAPRHGSLRFPRGPPRCIIGPHKYIRIGHSQGLHPV